MRRVIVDLLLAVALVLGAWSALSEWWNTVWSSPLRNEDCPQCTLIDGTWYHRV